jgi:[ribosomal protein S5]-alanine N-acetyltransferase
MLILETPRCYLRTFTESDLDDFIIYRNNSSWMKYQSFKNLSKEAYRLRLLQPLDIDNGIQLAIADKTTNTLIGDIYIGKKTNTISIGYTINPQFARQGYTTEILKHYLPVVREEYPLCEIIAMTDKDNIPSKNLLLKLGFVYDGYLEKLDSEVYLYQP